jgi:flagellar hook-associated protein 3 FlgL
MKTSAISSLAVSLALRNSTARLQGSLPGLQQEVVNGKHNDVGLALGAETRKLASFVADIDHTQRLIDTNEQVGTRLTATQESMTRMNNLADDLTNAVGIVMGHSGQNYAARQTAENVIAEMTSILNTQVNGVFVFSGLNADEKPMSDYETGGAKAAFDTAFQTYFGFGKNDAAAASITRAQIDDFMTTQVEPMFLGAGWNTNMSSATDEVMVSRISAEVTADTSVSANESSFRHLMLASVVATELYDSAMGAEAISGVSEYVISNAGTAAGSLTELQGQVGLVQERVERANEALISQKSLLETFASELESVDPYEKSIELNTLLTQIEVSYSVTARIQQLSLMNYL